MPTSSPNPAPVPGKPPPRLRVVALASGLLDDSQLAAVEAVVRQGGLPAESDDPRGWDKAVAVECVRRKLLTKFQARELLAGRRRFTLGQYRMLEEVGRGGMGQVFKAEHVMMKRIVAVKVLPLSKANPQTEAAFQREIEMLSKLRHDNIVSAHDSGHDGNVYYLVTEYVAGMDLRRHVSRHGPLDPHKAASVAVQVARALGYAHRRGLIHRDVKPSNILVGEDGRVRLLDLGLAGSVFDPESMQPGRRVGTPGYMAPEQIQGLPNVGPVADIFGLGCTLYFLLSGRPPFPGSNREEKERLTLAGSSLALRDLAPHVDASLAEVIELMMRLAPHDRAGSADEVVRLLQPWASGGPVVIPRAEQGSPPVKDVSSSAPLMTSGLESGSASELASRSDGLTLSDTSRGGDREETLSGANALPERVVQGDNPASPWLSRIGYACLLAAPMSAAAAVAVAIARMVFPGWGPNPLWGAVVVFLVVAGGGLAIASSPGHKAGP